MYILFEWYVCAWLFLLLLLFRCVVELKQKWNQNIHHNEDCVYRIIPTWRAWGTVQTLCYFVVCFQHYCFEDVSVYGFILIYMEKPSLESRLVHVHFVQCAICVKNKASENENINTRDNLQLSRWHRWDGNRTILFFFGFVTNKLWEWSRGSQDEPLPKFAFFEFYGENRSSQVQIYLEMLLSSLSHSYSCRAPLSSWA